MSHTHNKPIKCNSYDGRHDWEWALHSSDGVIGPIVENKYGFSWSKIGIPMECTICGAKATEWYKFDEIEEK